MLYVYTNRHLPGIADTEGLTHIPSNSLTISMHVSLTAKSQQLHVCWEANLGSPKPTLSTCLGRLKLCGNECSSGDGPEPRDLWCRSKNTRALRPFTRIILELPCGVHWSSWLNKSLCIDCLSLFVLPSYLPVRVTFPNKPSSLNPCLRICF